MKSFKPTETQIRCAEALMVAMAFEATIRPIVVAYETAILEKHRFAMDPKWAEYGMKERVILDRKDVFLLSDSDAQVFYAECFAARDAAKLKVDHPEACPLCAAEGLRLQAERELLTAMAETQGLEAFAKGFLTLEQRKKALDLMLHLLAPFTNNRDQLLARYA